MRALPRALPQLTGTPFSPPLSYSDAVSAELGRPVNTTGSPGFQEVVDGIDDVEFAFFNDGGAMAASTVYTQVPSLIRVSFTLFDPDAISVSDSTRRQQLIDQSKRSFSKIIFLRSE